MNVFQKIKANKRIKYGSFSLISIAVVLAVIIIINLIFGLAVTKFNIKFDLTSQGQFTLTDVSKDYIKSIDTDIKVYVFYQRALLEQHPVFYQVPELLDRYEQLNDKVNIEYLEIEKNPQYVSDYSNMALVAGDILFTSPVRNAKVAIPELVKSEKDAQAQSVQAISEAESALTSAFVSVTSKTQHQVSFLTGHGEETKDAESFMSLLRKNNFVVKEQNLMVEEIDPSTSYLVIVSPASDYSTEEIQKIDKFLTNDGNYGKNLLYFHTPKREIHQNLNLFFKEWGLSIGEGIVYETDSKKHGTNAKELAYVDYSEDVFSKDLKGNNLNVIVDGSNPIKLEFDKKGNRATKALLSFSPTAALKNPKAEYSDSDPKEAYPTMALSELTLYNSDGTAKKASNVIVSGSMLINKNALSIPSIGNADFMVRIFNGLIDKDDTLNIAPKVLSTTQMIITESQKTFITIVFAVLIPLGVIIAGIVVWRRRRSL